MAKHPVPDVPGVLHFPPFYYYFAPLAARASGNREHGPWAVKETVSRRFPEYTRNTHGPG